MASIETINAGDSALLAQRDLSQGVIVILSGGPFDWTNPLEVRSRMDQIIDDVNADPWVVTNTSGKGLIFRLLENQQTNHIHRARWRDLCSSPQLLAASPLIGHSNGGAAAMDLARFLNGQKRAVDLLFTADSVLTLDDNGDPYQVPPNGKLNLNSYSIPVFPIWWTILSLTGILNIGLRFEEPGALEHRDVFYDLGGGDPKEAGYQYPELIRDAALAVLKGATNQEIFQLAEQYMQVLADGAGISIALEGDHLITTLTPEGATAKITSPVVNDSTIAYLHQRMHAIEQIRLAIPDSEPHN